MARTKKVASQKFSGHGKEMMAKNLSHLTPLVFFFSFFFSLFSWSFSSISSSRARIMSTGFEIEIGKRQ